MKEGIFEVIDSFAVRRKGEFYLIGNLKQGSIEENWFLNVSFNASMALTIRIAAIEEIQMTNDPNSYKLLLIKGDSETIDFLLGMNISSEFLDITIEGKD
jgi:hypothetical protein